MYDLLSVSTENVKLEFYLQKVVHSKSEIEEFADNLTEVLEEETGECPAIGFYGALRLSDEEEFEDYAEEWSEDEDYTGNDGVEYEAEYKVFFYKIDDLEKVKEIIKEYDGLATISID